jgi:hypothetical protein
MRAGGVTLRSEADVKHGHKSNNDDDHAYRDHHQSPLPLCRPPPPRVQPGRPCGDALMKTGWALGECVPAHNGQHTKGDVRDAKQTPSHRIGEHDRMVALRDPLGQRRCYTPADYPASRGDNEKRQSGHAYRGVHEPFAETARPGRPLSLKLKTMDTFLRYFVEPMVWSIVIFLSWSTHRRFREARRSGRLISYRPYILLIMLCAVIGGLLGIWLVSRT